MPRPLRVDCPGCIHHVMNRGLQRRPLFELPSDQRRFLALLGCAVRRGWIRVHAFCLMHTHFHLVLESVDGSLSRTMQWLQSRHAGRFNRTRLRDGPLVRGRFTSIPVTTWAYFLVLVRYSDLNPVEAGLCKDPLTYPFSSARLHAGAPDGPPWLERRLVDRLLSDALQRGTSRRDAYQRVILRASSPQGGAQLVKARLGHQGRVADDLDAFLRADGAGRRAWIVRRALQADGTQPGLPMADTGSVRRILVARRLAEPKARLLGPSRRSRNLWDAAETGLLRDLAGLGFAAIARELRLAASTVRRRYENHLDALREDVAYLAILGDVARQILEHCFGPGLTEIVSRLASAHLSLGGAGDQTEARPGGPR